MKGALPGKDWGTMKRELLRGGEEGTVLALISLSDVEFEVND